MITKRAVVVALREAFHPRTMESKLGTIDTAVVPVRSVLTAEPVSSEGDEAYDDLREMIRTEGASLFLFMFDGGRPGGSWNTELILLEDGETRAFAILLPGDEEPVAIASLAAPSSGELDQLAQRLFLEVVASEDVMYFPTEVSAGVPNAVLERGLIKLLKWQRETYGGYAMTAADPPPDNASDQALTDFVRNFLASPVARGKAAPKPPLTWIATGTCQECYEQIILWREPRRWSHASGVDRHEPRRTTLT